MFLVNLWNHLRHPELGIVKDQKLLERLSVVPIFNPEPKDSHPITYLVLSGNPIGDMGIGVIATALKTNAILLGLDITKCSIGPIGAESLASALANNESLVSVSASTNPFGDTGVAHFAKALTQNSTLLRLHLISVSMTAVGALSLAKALLENISLCGLDLEHNPIGDQGVGHLTMALPRNTGLRALDLSYCGITAMGASFLAGVLSQSLLEICLLYGNEGIGDEGAEKIGSVLNTSRLRVLNLGFTGLTDKGHQALANALAHNTILVDYSSPGNTIGDAGAVSFGEALQTNSSLQQLNLSSERSQITEPGVLSLAQGLKNHPALQKFSLYGARRTLAGDDSLLQVVSKNMTLRELDIGPPGSLPDADLQRILKSRQRRRFLLPLRLLCVRLVADLIFFKIRICPTLTSDRFQSICIIRNCYQQNTDRF